MVVRKLEALFTINTNVAQFKKAASELDKLANKAETVMKAIAGYWAVSALKNFVATTAKGMSEIGNKAQYLGVATEALQELHYAAQKSGVSLDAIDDALKEIQIRAVDAKSGTGEAAEAFNMLNDLNVTDKNGQIKKPLQLLEETADGIKSLRNHSQRMWVADAIFGDEGSTILKMLDEGAAGLNKMRQEARALGVVLDTESIAKTKRFSTSLMHAKTTFQITGNAFVQGIMRPLSWLMETVSALAAAFNRLSAKASVVRVTLLSLSGIIAALAIKGGVILAAFLVPFLPMIGVITAVVAGIVAASIAIEDLYVAIKGGHSVFAELFNGVKNFCLVAYVAVQKGFEQAFASMRTEFSIFSHWLSEGLAKLVQKATSLLASMVPDFVKNGFAATIKMMGGFNEGTRPSQFN